VIEDGGDAGKSVRGARTHDASEVVNDVDLLIIKCDKRKRKVKFGPVLDTRIASKVAA